MTFNIREKDISSFYDNAFHTFIYFVWILLSYFIVSTLTLTERRAVDSIKLGKFYWVFTKYFFTVGTSIFEILGINVLFKVKCAFSQYRYRQTVQSV